MGKEKMSDEEFVANVRAHLLGRGFAVLTEDDGRTLDVGLVVAMTDRGTGDRVLDRLTLVEATILDEDMDTSPVEIATSIEAEVRRYASPLAEDKSKMVAQVVEGAEDLSHLSADFQEFLESGSHRDNFVGGDGKLRLRPEVSGMVWQLNSLAITEDLMAREAAKANKGR
jgi:hypothetical protein